MPKSRTVETNDQGEQNDEILLCQFHSTSVASGDVYWRRAGGRGAEYRRGLLAETDGAILRGEILSIQRVPRTHTTPFLPVLQSSADHFAGRCQGVRASGDFSWTPLVNGTGQEARLAWQVDARTFSICRTGVTARRAVKSSPGVDAGLPVAHLLRGGTDVGPARHGLPRTLVQQQAVLVIVDARLECLIALYIPVPRAVLMLLSCEPLWRTIWRPTW